jgi:hypothetical protein
MNETQPEKFESKTTTQCIKSIESKNMNTTHSMNAGVAIGLAQKSNPTLPVVAVRPAATFAMRRKTLVLGLLTVASCAATILWFKAAVIIGQVLAALDATYANFCT